MTDKTLPTPAEEKRARAREFDALLTRLPSAPTSLHDRMLHTAEEFTCSVLPQPRNYHFEGKCEDCDAHYLSRMPLGQIEDLYRTGRVTQEQYEAYTLVWALLSPTRDPSLPDPMIEDPIVRRVARKLCRAKGLPIPAAVIEPAPVVELPAPVAAELGEVA
jgi:hypothetical protein